MDLLCFLLPVIIFGGAFFVFRWLKTNIPLDLDWGDFYNKKLGLSSAERNTLNRISSQVKYKSFYRIDFCKDNAIDLFLTAYKLLPYIPNENQSVDLFDYCTSELQKVYRVDLPNRKLDAAVFEKQQLSIPDSVKEKIEKACSDLPELTPEQEKMLYSVDGKRWRVILENLETNYSDSIQFYNEVKFRESLNTSIVARRNLYYDSYLFMMDKDKTVALKFYIHYLNVGSESDHFKFRDISRKNQKILFANETQSGQFQEILDKYNKKKDLNQTLSEIEDVFTKKRKKVILDEKAIESAKEDLVGVVDLLNEYLEDEEKTEERIPPLVQNLVSAEFVKVEFADIQSEFLERLASESFTLSLIEVDTFANTKGVFKSQLIDGINELCYDILDDMLIEEDENGYTMNERYYKQLY